MPEVATATQLIAVYNLHAFQVTDTPLEFDDGVAWIRLSRAGWTPCNSGEEAALREGFLDVFDSIDNRSESELPSGFGLIANRRSEIIGIATEVGAYRVAHVRTDGAQVPTQARMSIVSLAQDEAFDGRAFALGAADYWAMGRPT